MINELACAIILRAVEDYRLLLKDDVDEIHYNDGSRISKTEIERFFRSPWCEFLLGEMHITGEEILKHLQR